MTYVFASYCTRRRNVEPGTYNARRLGERPIPNAEFKQPAQNEANGDLNFGALVYDDDSDDTESENSENKDEAAEMPFRTKIFGICFRKMKPSSLVMKYQ